MKITRSLLLMSLVAAGLSTTVCAEEHTQAQADFEVAIRDRSTSHYVVLLTVVDDRNGQSRTGCTEANFLLGAIILEYLGGYGKTNSENISKNQQAQKIALDNRSHEFHFSTQPALDNLPFEYEAACDEVVHGHRVRLSDIGRHVIIEER
jgi:hypothetical protein